MEIFVLGVSADGEALAEKDHRRRLAEADVVVGGERHLALLATAGLPVPDGQQRLPWPAPLRPGLADWPSRFAGRRVLVLASGDPLVSGIGSTLVEMFGPERVQVEPAVSSVALARAEMRWAAETVTVLRDHRELPRHLWAGSRILILSADETVPGEVAELLSANGFGESRMTVLGDLGSASASSLTATADTWAGHPVPRLHVLAIEPAAAADRAGLGLAAGLPDSAYEHDGQLTKRDLRASALARLAPVPGELLWDVGAGSGSVGIEWLRHHRRCRAIAVESDPARAQRISRNARALGVPGLEVVHGRAPEALAALPQPAAIFIGGGASRDGVLDHCWAALPPGGRLVVHAVTAETEALLVARYREHGGELLRWHTEQAQPLGGFTGWTPRRAVSQWAVTR